MRTIYQYPLVFGMNDLKIPGGICGATVGHMPGQLGKVQLWTAVDPYKPLEMAHVFLAKTGEEIPENCSLIGTVLLNGGAVAVHALLV